MNEPVTKEIQLNAKVEIAKGFRLQWEEAQQCHVLLFPEGMVQLNETAADILQLCKQNKFVSEVITDLETQYDSTDLQADVLEFLDEALKNGWVKLG